MRSKCPRGTFLLILVTAVGGLTGGRTGNGNRNSGGIRKAGCARSSTTRWDNPFNKEGLHDLFRSTQHDERRGFSANIITSSTRPRPSLMSEEDGGSSYAPARQDVKKALSRSALQTGPKTGEFRVFPGGCRDDSTTEHYVDGSSGPLRWWGCWGWIPYGSNTRRWRWSFWPGLGLGLSWSGWSSRGVMA